MVFLYSFQAFGKIGVINQGSSPLPKVGTQIRCYKLLKPCFFYNEVFEFAARLSLSEVGTETMYISIKACNLKNRILYNALNPAFRLLQPNKALLNDFPYEKEFTKEELISNPRELALQGCAELFKRFSWNASTQQLAEIFKQILAL